MEFTFGIITGGNNFDLLDVVFKSIQDQYIDESKFEVIIVGGEEVEADMRYDGGFMPYGEEPKADDVPARLSKDEFVFTDQAVAGAGDGDIDLGAERLYNVMKSLEAGGRLSEETQGETAQGIGTII